MKKLSIPTITITLVCALVISVRPLTAVVSAEEVALDPVLITEFQTGAGTASQEFIELYNPNGQSINVSGWQLRFANPGSEPTVLATIADTADSPTFIEGHSYYILDTTGTPIPGNGQAYTSGLSKTDKTLALYAADRTTCQYVIQDAVAWEVVPNNPRGEGAPVPVASDIVNKEKLFQRYRDAEGLYVDTDNNAHDFRLTAAVLGTEMPGVAVGASPGLPNAALLSEGSVTVGSVSPLPPIAISGCVPPEPAPEPSTPPEADEPDVPAPPEAPGSTDTPEVPPAEQSSESQPEESTPPESETPPPSNPNAGLIQPYLSEILPNPAPPQTDEHDEFIELYNPNSQAFDLSGFILETGLTSTHRYTIPANTLLAAQSYVAFFAGTTGLSISNSSGQVRLFSPQGVVLTQTDPYTTAKDGQAWALMNEVWQWTTMPTPNALNANNPPATAIKKAVAAATAKKAATKTTAAKGSSTKATSKAAPKAKSAKATETVKPLAVVSPPKSSLHTGVLAAVGISALLYGAYEYRRDLANKFHQFRTNRTAGRTDRPKSEGRRNN